MFENQISSLLDFSKLAEPIKYRLNLKLDRQNDSLIKGSIDILLKILNTTDWIALHAGASIIKIVEQKIFLWNCNQGFNINYFN